MTTTDQVRIFDAVTHNDEKTLKYLVEVEGMPVNLTNSHHLTAAHMAAKVGNLPILQYLLDKDASLLTAMDKTGHTVLHLATERGTLEMVKYLVEDCKMDIFHPISHCYKNLPVHVAAHNGHLILVKYFMEEKKVTVDVKNGVGETCMFLAAENIHLHVVKYLVEERNADVTDLDNNWDNILFISAKNGDVSVPRYVLDERKGSLDFKWRDYLGDTILHRAARFASLDFIKYLTEEKNADINFTDTLNRTPLYEAAIENHLHIVKYLLEHGADPDIKDLHGYKPINVTRNEDVINCLKTMSHRSRRSVSSPRFTHVAPSLITCRRIRRFNLSLPSLEKQHRNFVSTIENVLPHFDGFLLLANICVKYYNKNPYRGRRQFFSSPSEFIENRINSMAVDVIIESLTSFETQ